MISTLHIQLFGTFRLWFGQPFDADRNDAPSVEAEQVASLRMQSLLAYLLLNDGPQSRQQLAYLFWPDASDRQARTNLRNLNFQLRKALPDIAQFISHDRQTIGWKPDAPFTCDVLELSHRLAQIEANPHDERLLAEIRDLYRGELLPSCYDDWIEPLRAQLRRDVARALLRLLEIEQGRGDFDEAIQTAHRLLEMDPLDEESHQRLLRLHVQNDDRAGALRHYRELVSLLHSELDVEPDEQTQELYAQILDGTLAAGSEHLAQRWSSDRFPLIGRDAEWQQLQQLWQESLRRRPHLVLITGLAGIGKTRLAEELLQWASNQGAVVARARSYSAHGAMAYAPVADLLRTPALLEGAKRLDDPWLASLARILPELLSDRPDLPLPEPMTEAWQRRQFQDALVRAISMHSQPILLLLDDLQWCDTETLAWIEHLLHSAANRRLLLVGTVRQDEIEPSHPLIGIQHRLRRDDRVTEIALAPLSQEDAATLARQVAGTTLAFDAAEQIFADTEGNPLFVVETVRAKQDQDVGDATEGAVAGLPPKVYAVIQSRLSLLSSHARVVAALAAVIGRSFSFEVLLRSSTDGEDELLDSLDELSRRSIIREHSAESFDFSHDRLRDVAYAEIGQTRRRILHRRVAQGIEAVNPDEQGEHSGVLAEHFEQAGDTVRALDYLQQAGEWSAMQYASEAAADYFARALAIVSESDLLRRVHLLLAREQAHALLGLFDAWELDLMSLRQMIEAIDPQSREENEYAALIYTRWTHWYYSKGDYEHAVHVGRMAIGFAESSGNAALQSDAYRRVGLLHWRHGIMDRAHESLEHALVAARSAEDLRLEATALDWLSAVAMYSGVAFSTILEHFHSALLIHEQTDDLEGQINLHFKLMYALIAQGEDGYQEAIVHSAAGLKLCRNLTLPSAESPLLQHLGWLNTYLGEYGKAQEALLAALALVEGKYAAQTVRVHRFLGLNYMESGDLARARSYLEQCLVEPVFANETSPDRAMTLEWLSLTCMYARDYESALDHARKALQNAKARGDSRHAGAALTCMGHAFVGLDDLNQAKESYREARRHYLDMEQFNRSMEPLAGLAQVALLTNDLDQAMKFVEQILSHIETNNLDRTEEVFQVYLVCYRVLTKLDDPRAESIRQLVYEQLQARAASLDGEDERQRFWSFSGHQEFAVPI